MRMHVLRHVSFETEARIADWAAGKGIELVTVDCYAGDALPDPSEIEWLTVMGGPMGVHDEDEYPWMAPEKQLIEQCIDAETMVLGFCLGAQLIADVLGAVVMPSLQKEMGFHPVFATEDGAHHALLAGLPPSFMAFHWHLDATTLPPGATHLLSSPGCEVQAFSYENIAVGFQCHLETTPAMVEALLTHASDDLTPGGPYVQTPDAMRTARHYDAMGLSLFRILDNLLESASHDD